MVIGTCGFGSTGSSAVSDYLKEFNENCVMDGIEFTLTFVPDGLIDLEYHLMYPHSRTSDSICAIERFRYMILCKRGRYITKKTGISMQELRRITDDFLDSITQVSWPGYQNYNNSFWKENFGGRILYYKILPFLERKFNLSFDGYPKTPLRFSVRPSNFYEEARNFNHIILEHMGADYSKNIVLDQPFSGNNPASCFPFFNEPIAIVVDRDPRDNYVFAKTKLKGNNNGFMPTENVVEFVKYYRALRDNQPYKENNARVMRIQFEEMVYDYDIATKKIRDFINLPENPNPKSIFDPSLSVANTQVFVRYPQFFDDVKYIEEQLPEYLFDFSKYDKPDLSGEMFFGRSPKNK